VLTTELTRVIDTVEGGAAGRADAAGRPSRAATTPSCSARFVSAADRYLGDHHAELRQLFEGRGPPAGVPDAVYRRVFDRLYNPVGAERLVAMAADPR